MLTLNYIKKTFEFSKTSNVPFYSQLASYIEIQIQTGILKPGEKMLTEKELCEALHVSRTTVRQALSQIVDKGLMFRYRRRGTFIAEKKIERNINYLYNFTESIKNNNFQPSSLVLTCKRIEANSTISKILKLSESCNNVFFWSV
jgi:GntR family transcriptional regulator